MSEAKLLESRELIAEGNYESARILLEPLDDPEARAMLAELDARREEGATRFTASEADVVEGDFTDE